MFNIISSELPTKHMGCRVRTDFKQIFKFFNILESDELDQDEKALCIMECLFFSNPPNDPKLWDFINSFISGGQKEEKGGGSKVFDFLQDSGLIYAAFWQIYGINLRNVDMHWWEFLELFKALPDGTMLSKVIEIRSKDIDDKMDSKTRAKLMQLKARHMLKTKETFKPQF